MNLSGFETLWQTCSRLEYTPTVNEEGKRALKIFLEFWVLIALLAAFNLYNYFRGGSKLFLAVGVVCVLGFIGWALFYLLYVRRKVD